MSGHSKWSNIKDRKMAQDKKRGAAFTKVLRGVQIAAQTGGNPDSNFALRLAIDAAKSVGVPKENIERAIKRGTGEDKEGTQMEEVLYEGYGPGKIAVLVECVTDSKNRASSDVKHVFSKYGGSFGGAGSVQWMFDKKAVIELSPENVQSITDKDSFQLALMDAGAGDIDDEENGGIYVSGAVDHFSRLCAVVREFGIAEPLFMGVVWDAKDTVHIDHEHAQQWEDFLEKMHELDDVKEVYSNMGDDV